MIHGVIGIGSNSTRLLVGRIENGKVEPLLRMREGTRLFDGLQDGALSQESMLRAADAVARFAKAALDAGAEKLHVLATSAARDAANGDELAALIEGMAGAPLTILSGEEEARLSFLGGGGYEHNGLIDIGGGSTEVAVGGGGWPLMLASAQLGAVRLLGEVPLLAGDGVAQAFALARTRVLEATASIDLSKPLHFWFGVGGTLTCLASVDMRLPQFDRDAVDGHTMSIETVENWARRLAKLPVAERAKLPGMLPTRADIIAHGAIALWGAMDALGIAKITVSNRTNLDGYLRDIAEHESDGVAKVKATYDENPQKEWDRLGYQRFELEINRAYIDRFVKPGDRVLDAGGGPGRYSLHLAQRGAEVTLLDLSEGNVRFAAQKAAEMNLPLRTVCADARVLDEVVEGQFDVVLLMGPLYHLKREADRVRTVQACLKKLKPGGVLCVAFISTMGGMVFSGRKFPESILWPGEELFYDAIKAREDFAGEGFTSMYMIDVANVRPFMERFPLETLHIVGSEGVTAPYHDRIMAVEDSRVFDEWLKLSLATCEQTDMLCFSEHFLYIGRKKGNA